MTTTKKMRCPRATDKQFNAMLDFFNENEGMSEGKLKVSHGKDYAKQKWEELSQVLNSLRGPKKTGQQWQLTWRDLKGRVSNKARALRRERFATGSVKPNEGIMLTEIDHRVISILGQTYIEGSNNCADSMPEEKEFQERLFDTDTPAVNIPCDIVSIKTEEPFCEETATEGSFQTGYNNNTLTTQDKPNSSTQSPYLETTTQKNTNSENQTKSYAHLRAAREQFAKIANTHADALKTFAEGSKMQASALERIAGAMEKISEAVTLLANNIKQKEGNFSKDTNN